MAKAILNYSIDECNDLNINFVDKTIKGLPNEINKKMI